MILGIDPGPQKTALVMYDETANRVESALHLDNGEAVDYLKAMDRIGLVAIEKIASFGMPVGAEVFETCFWIGEFRRILKDRLQPFAMITRVQVKSAICHDTKAKDANIRQALIDRIGPQGTKKAPGPTYGVFRDMWAALAVSVASADCLASKAQRAGAAA